MTSGKYPIRDIFRKFYPAYSDAHPDLSIERIKTAECIIGCKTGELGYDISVCEKCGHPVIHAVSCNNRSCPCCQSHLSQKWEMERNTELIEGIAYYHVIFTVPHELNNLIYFNEKPLLNLLFKSVHETLLTLCADPRYMGAKPGIISVLHTWGQKLNFHPHIHVCISGGGITPAGRFVETRHKGFFMPEAVIASMFRGKFLCALKELYDNGALCFYGQEHLQNPPEWNCFINLLFEKRWLPFVKETFNGKGNAVRYLARYSYRTAIANSRIVSHDDKNVTFSYKDYADDNKQKTLTVSGESFIRMYLQHILPSGFHRFRFAGYLANCSKHKNLLLIHRLRNTSYLGNLYKNISTAELMRLLYNKDICVCPECSGKLIQLPRGTPISILPSSNKPASTMC
jgi:hypothetical protein